MSHRTYIWRTHGGLYAMTDDRIGKLCSLRTNPHGVEPEVPEPGDLYEAIDTPYGERFRLIRPADVQPGMKLHISYQRAGWVTTSPILDGYLGSQVDAVLHGAPHVVFTRERAWLLLVGDPNEAIPLLARGWSGRYEQLDLDALDRPTILRTDAIMFGERAGMEWIDEHAAGWRDAIHGLADDLRRLDPHAAIADARIGDDGLLRMRLVGIGVDADGQIAEEFERAVMQETGSLQQLCTVCGDPAEPTSVSDEYSAGRIVRSLCEFHAVKMAASRASASGVRTHAASSRLDTAQVNVEPGRYPILARLDEQLAALSEYAVDDCSQHFGELVFRTRVPDFTEGLVIRRMRELVHDAETAAVTTCEHCGASGTRHETPWVHVCCDSCAAQHELQPVP